jgi:hypothetical protein
VPSFAVGRLGSCASPWKDPKFLFFIPERDFRPMLGGVSYDKDGKIIGKAFTMRSGTSTVYLFFKNICLAG